MSDELRASIIQRFAAIGMIGMAMAIDDMRNWQTRKPLGEFGPQP